MSISCCCALSIRPSKGAKKGAYVSLKMYRWDGVGVMYTYIILQGWARNPQSNFELGFIDLLSAQVKQVNTLPDGLMKL
jgi:hypothetical protein